LDFMARAQGTRLATANSNLSFPNIEPRERIAIGDSMEWIRSKASRKVPHRPKHLTNSYRRTGEETNVSKLALIDVRERSRA
jgi:hypothetical protein